MFYHFHHSIRAYVNIVGVRVRIKAAMLVFLLLHDGVPTHLTSYSGEGCPVSPNELDYGVVNWEGWSIVGKLHRDIISRIVCGYRNPLWQS